MEKSIEGHGGQQRDQIQQGKPQPSDCYKDRDKMAAALGGRLIFSLRPRPQW